MFHCSLYRRSGFTLVEMLVAIAVLAILVLLINQLFAGASQTMTGSTKHITADEEARLVFNRLAGDFAGMVRRTDVDFLFVKQPATGAPEPNDGFWFYSQAPGYTQAGTPATDLSPMSLVGYRVNGSSLERLGKRITWDNGASNGNTAGASNGYTGLIFLVPNPGGSGWNPLSLIGGSTTSGSTATWPNSVGTFSNQFSISSGTGAGHDPDYQALGPDVFRFEYCFLLKDGTYSDYPVLSVQPGTWGTNPLTKGFTFSDNQKSSPPSTAASATYTAGSRYYDTADCEGYICTNANASSTTWASLGMQDVAAVVVSIGVLDANSRLLATSALSSPTSAFFKQFPDSNQGNALSQSPPQLPAQVWNANVESPTFAATASIPQLAASQVRVYQRFFYLNQ